MARMPEFRRLSNGELILGYTREADEVFKKNSAEQDKRRDKNELQLMRKPPEEVIINKEYLTPAYCCCFVYKNID